MRYLTLTAALLAASPACAQAITQEIPYPVATAKVTETDVSVTATTSIPLLAANPYRIGVELQCATGPVKVSKVGAVLTSATQGSGPAGTIVNGTFGFYQPQYVVTGAWTAYAATTVICTVTEFSR